MTRFKSISENHAKSRLLIEQIEKTKKSIQANEKRLLPLPELTLRTPYIIEQGTLGFRDELGEIDIDILVKAFVFGIKQGQYTSMQVEYNWKLLAQQILAETPSQQTINIITKINDIVSKLPKNIQANDVGIIKGYMKKLLSSLSSDTISVSHQSPIVNAMSSMPWTPSEVELDWLIPIMEGTPAANTTYPAELEGSMFLQQQYGSTLSFEPENEIEQENTLNTSYSEVENKVDNIVQKIVSSKQLVTEEQLGVIYSNIVSSRQNITQEKALNHKALAILYIMSSYENLPFVFWSESANATENRKVRLATEYVQSLLKSYNFNTLLQKYVFNSENPEDKQKRNTIFKNLKIIAKNNESPVAGSGLSKPPKQPKPPKSSKSQKYKTEQLITRTEDIVSAIHLGNKTEDLVKELKAILSVLMDRKEITKEDLDIIMNSL
jgi:hypothetical protein